MKISKSKKDSPLLLARTSKKLPSKYQTPIDQTKSFKISKQILFQPIFFNVDSSYIQNNLIYSLKESLTVKKINISKQKASPNLNSVPVRYRKQAQAIGQVESLNTLPRPRQKARSVGERLQSTKPKTIEKSDSLRNTQTRNTAVKKDHLTPRVPSYTPPVIRPPKQYPKMMFKEAMRNLNWCLKARPELDRMWRRFICKSNGLETVQAEKCLYKFFVGKGNNSRLIFKTLASRTWWVESDRAEDANYVWTQWKDKEYLQKMKMMNKSSVFKHPAGAMQVISPVPFVADNQVRPVDIEDLGFHLIRNSSSYIQLESNEADASELRMYNRIEYNQHLANKKGLFKSMKKYYEALGKNVFDYVPITFHIKNEEGVREFEETFYSIDREKKCQNMWIIKPGENSNRGQGISVACTLDHIKQLISTQVDPVSSQARTYIIQKYIEKPFLIHKRKFDIRCYALITSINGIIQGYSYADGYLRTTSTEYSIKDISNNFIHLTNDAIQKYSDEYGKFEDGNKLSYKDFQRYIDFHYSEKKVNFVNDLLPLIKNLIKDSIQAVFLKLDPKKRQHCMEIFGYDFMIDANLKPWLIEVNTNPCLELASGYLTNLIPAMIDNAFRIAIDPLFPPPKTKHIFESFTENKFELVFHSETDGENLLRELGEKKELLLDCEEISDKEEVFSDRD